jgi:hypothetical protein
MKRSYFCPHCGATLNPNVKVILTASSGKTRGLILFSPQPGNYDAIVPEELGLSEGQMVDFSCPVCRADLTSPEVPRLAYVSFRTSTGVEGRVKFSRKFGERATFVITGEEVRSYGENAAEYMGMNFFGAGNPELE